VVGILPGRIRSAWPNRSSSGPYDTWGGGESSLAPSRTARCTQAADDNASGVAGVIGWPVFAAAGGARRTLTLLPSRARKWG